MGANRTDFQKRELGVRSLWAPLSLLSLLGACAQQAPTPSASTVLPRGALAYAPSARDPICAITRVVDGDTIDVLCKSGGSGNVRLTGFDTPETNKPGCAAERALGLRAKGHLEGLLRGATLISLRSKGPDKYQRLLAEVRLDNQSLAALMITAGLAVPYDGGKRINWCQRLART